MTGNCFTTGLKKKKKHCKIFPATGLAAAFYPSLPKPTTRATPPQRWVLQQEAEGSWGGQGGRSEGHMTSQCPQAQCSLGGGAKQTPLPSNPNTFAHLRLLQAGSHGGAHLCLEEIKSLIPPKPSPQEPNCLIRPTGRKKKQSFAKDHLCVEDSHLKSKCQRVLKPLAQKGYFLAQIAPAPLPSHLSLLISASYVN